MSTSEVTPVDVIYYVRSRRDAGRPKSRVLLHRVSGDPVVSDRGGTEADGWYFPERALLDHGRIVWVD